MNLTTIRDAVRRHTGLLSVELVPDATVDAYVLEAFAEVLDADAWPWLEQHTTITTAAGVSDYNVHPGLGLVQVAVEGDNKRVLERVSPQTVASDINMLLLQAMPQEYAVLHGLTQYADQVTLRLYPTPFKAERLDVTYRRDLMADLASGVSVQTMLTNGSLPNDIRIEQAVAYGAAVRLLNREADDSPRARSFQVEYSALVQRMREAYMRDRSQQAFQFGGRRGDAAMRRLSRSLGRIR